MANFSYANFLRGDDEPLKKKDPGITLYELRITIFVLINFEDLNVTI